MRRLKPYFFRENRATCSFRPPDGDQPTFPSDRLLKSWSAGWATVWSYSVRRVSHRFAGVGTETLSAAMGGDPLRSFGVFIPDIGPHAAPAPLACPLAAD